MKYSTIIPALLLLLTASCIETPTTNVGGNTAGAVVLWMAADADAHVSCGSTATCEEGDQNFGAHGTLAVGHWELGLKQAYVRFVLPILPAGTVVKEAYMELYHPAKNGDGRTDDIDIPVMRATEAWSPMTITWNNRPDRGGTPAADFTIDLRSQGWSGSANIVDQIRPMLARPDSNFGFIVFWRSQLGTPAEKGFYSNNDIRRKQNDLGLSPRLLLKIELPAGKTTSDITLPFFASDSDLSSFPRPITMLRFSPGSSFPADWAATAQ